MLFSLKNLVEIKLERGKKSTRDLDFVLKIKPRLCASCVLVKFQRKVMKMEKH